MLHRTQTPSMRICHLSSEAATSAKDATPLSVETLASCCCPRSERHKPLASSIRSAAFSPTQHSIFSDRVSYAGMCDRLYIFGGNNEVTMAGTSWVNCHFSTNFSWTASSLGNSLELFNLVRRMAHGTVIRTAGALVFCSGLFA